MHSALGYQNTGEAQRAALELSGLCQASGPLVGLLAVLLTAWNWTRCPPIRAARAAQGGTAHRPGAARLCQASGPVAFCSAR